MSRQFLTGLNLNKNELLNASIHNSPTAPSSPAVGQIYFDTAIGHLRQWDGAQWLSYASLAELQTAITSGTQTNITVTYDSGTDTYSFVAENGVADSTTDDLQEGTNNLYFTEQRAIDAVGGSATYLNDPDTVMKRDSWGQTEIGHIYVQDRVSFTGYNGGTDAGQIQNNGGNLNVDAYNGDLELNADQNVVVTSNNGDINLNPDGNVHVNAAVIATGNLQGLGVYAGGQGNGNGGTIEVQDQNDTQVFVVDAVDNSLVRVAGTLDVAPAGQVYSVVRITDDGNGSGVINGWNNNLILSSDNGAQGVYAGQIGDDYRVVTEGLEQNLYNKYLGNAVLDNDLNANNHQIGNLADPQNPQDAATKAYVDNVAAGLTWKAAVNLLWDDPDAELTGETGTLLIDGHMALSTIYNGYRILISSGSNAGIWVYSDDNAIWTLTRATDGDVYTELKGATVFVEEGTVYGQSAWTQGNHYITDFTGQDWVQFSGAAQITAGAGLTKTGNQIDVVGTADRITANANSVDIASTYVGQTSITTLGTITSGTWNGTTISVEDGGTGATTPVAARANLGATTKYAENNPALTAVSGAVTWVVTHGLATEDVTVQLKDISSKQLVEVDVEITNSNSVTLSWVSSDVVDDAFRVVIVG